jgi:hypothetical protein
VGEDEAVQARERLLAPLEPGQVSARVEADRSSCLSVGDSGLDPLPCAGNAIEESDDLVGVGVSLVDRVAQERTGERSFTHMRAPGDTRELLAVLRRERDVEANAVLSHTVRVTRFSTGRVRTSTSRAAFPAAKLDGVTEALALVMVNDEHPAGPTRAWEIVDTEQMPYEPSSVVGLVIKKLRVDPETGEWTWLAGSAPNRVTPRAEVHPTVEEAFLIRGDCLLASTGK